MTDDCAFCEGDAKGDHRLTITSPGEAEYTLSFGSGIRKGEITQFPPGVDVEEVSTGRRMVYRSTVSNSAHVWIAFGAVRLENHGPDQLRIVTAGDREKAVSVAPGATFSMSCPTTRKRVAALGAVAGAALGGVGGAVLKKR